MTFFLPMLQFSARKLVIPSFEMPEEDREISKLSLNDDDVAQNGAKVTAFQRVFFEQLCLAFLHFQVRSPQPDPARVAPRNKR
jgi:hypothetical protein